MNPALPPFDPAQASALASPSFTLTLSFAIALVVGLVLKFWLASRQIRHVALNRNTVPTAFAAVTVNV